LLDKDVDLKDFAISGGIFAMRPSKPFWCAVFTLTLIDKFDYRLIISNEHYTHIRDELHSNLVSYRPKCLVGGIVVDTDLGKKNVKFS